MPLHKNVTLLYEGREKEKHVRKHFIYVQNQNVLIYAGSKIT